MTSRVLATVALAGFVAAPFGARASLPDDIERITAPSGLVIGRPVAVSPALADRGVIRANTITVPADFFRSIQDEAVEIEIETGRFIELVEQERRTIGEITYVVGADQLTPYSRFIIQLRGGVPYRGEIRLFNEVINLVSPQPNNGDVVFQMLTIDPTLIPLEQEPVETENLRPDSGADDSSHSSDAPADPPALADDGQVMSDEANSDELLEYTEISLMVAYTPAAKAQVEFWNPPLTIEQVITDQVVYANFGFQAQAGVTLNLVHIQPVKYTETNSIAKDLQRLECPCDHKNEFVGSNNLNQIFAPWKSKKADIVNLWIHSPSNQSGIANIMRTVSTDWAPRAVSVVDWRAATGRLSFDHEIGHNFGARHDWAQDTTNNKPYSFNHGYIDVPSKQGTIMAYESTCLLLGYLCSRTVYWSDPLLPPPGSTGIPSGLFLATDNAQALSLSAPTVANFDSKHDDLLGCCINVGTFWKKRWKPGPCP